MNLALLTHGQASYMDSIEGRRSLTVFSRVGLHAPLHCAASGKVLLAAMGDGQFDRWLAGRALDRQTPHTIIDVGVLRKELEQIRQQGFALDLEECEEGMCCVAAPVRNGRGETIAAISISGPSVRMRARVQELEHSVVLTAGRISAQLGWGGSAQGPFSEVRRSSRCEGSG